MLWKIQKSLGNVVAVQVDSVAKDGVCLDLKNFKEKNASILIYTNGQLEDICINGCQFPCVYNDMDYDIYGRQFIRFDYIDSMGAVQKVHSRRLPGANESLATIYLYTLINYISYCKDEVQVELLIDYIINDISIYGRETAIDVLTFIESFNKQLSNIQDDEFVPGLKRKLNIKYKEAQAIISKIDRPE